MPTKAAVNATKAMTVRIISTVAAVLKDPCSKFWDPDGVVAAAMDSKLNDTEV